MDAEEKEYEGTCTVRVCVVVVYFRKYGRNMYTRAMCTLSAELAVDR